MRHMRRSIGLAIVALAITAGSAVAVPPHAGCPVGAGNSGSSGIEAWALWDEATLAQEFADANLDPNMAAVIFASEDKNGDQLLCVLKQVLPNDASGNTTWFVSRDNNTGVN